MNGGFISKVEIVYDKRLVVGVLCLVSERVVDEGELVEEEDYNGIDMRLFSEIINGEDISDKL